jgi:hypothetical protein
MIVIVHINMMWPNINEPGRRRSYVNDIVRMLLVVIKVKDFYYYILLKIFRGNVRPHTKKLNVQENIRE